MRLFIAINFNDQIKDSLCETMQKLKNVSVRGNFVRRENLHLTVAFIGETLEIGKVKQAMDKVSAEPFDLKLSGFGKFQRDRGDIYWVGVEQNANLFLVYNQLLRELSHAGFAIEKRDYKPHLTLGREVVLDSALIKMNFANRFHQ